MLFHNPTQGTLLFEDVVGELVEFLSRSPTARYQISIGSDSEVRGGTVECISAIVIHRVGNGARYFWMRTVKEPFHSLRERIWHEAICSTSLARSVLDALTERDAWGGDIEVHIDVGQRGPTRDLIQELCGYVRAYGFAVAIKPKSYAASAVADKYT